MVSLKEIKCKGSGRKKKMRVGRGPGSGKGKTSGRGMKGQGSRSGTGGKMGFEGGQMPLYRRLPKRGFTNAPFKVVYTTINVGDLEVLNEGDQVDLALLKTKGMIKKNAKKLKILGGGELKTKLKIQADNCSASARQKIEAVGGEIEVSR